MRVVQLTRERFEEVFVLALVMVCAVVVLAGGGFVVLDAHAREGEVRARALRVKRAPGNLLTNQISEGKQRTGAPVSYAGWVSTGPGATGQRGSIPLPSVHSLYEITAYSHGCILPRSGKEGHARRAANGRWPIADHTVAADTTLHPFGTEVLIEGLGYRTVGDRGHAIKGRKLDLFVDSCKEARAFGRRWLKVIPVPPESTREALEF